MADAALTAYDLHDDETNLDILRRAHRWFHGENSLRLPLADVECGGCCDGLTAGGVNRNQGAESTLAYLWTELLNLNLQNSFSDSHSAAGAAK
jgi:hypothetical protein